MNTTFSGNNHNRFTPTAVHPAGSLGLAPPLSVPVAATTVPVSMRPTLFLGIGGSGHRMLLNVKAAFGDAIPDWVRFMVFDSAHEDLRIQQGRHTVRIEPGSELVYIGDVSIPAIMRNLDRLPTLGQNFGDVLRAMPRVTYRDGVGGNRDAGRLSFHYHAADIAPILASVIRSLTSREGAGKEGLTQSAGLNIGLCASTCGGQGSGALLDLAYLLRELLDVGEIADSSVITGFFLLPDAFPGVQNQYMEANAAAFCQALEGYMDRGGFEATLPGGLKIGRPISPMDRVFLLGGIDQKGRTRSSHAQVCAAAGQMIYLLYATSAGQKLENNLFNHQGILAARTREGELACFATLGLATLAGDSATLQQACARRYAADIIPKAFLAPPNAQRATQSGADLINAAGLEKDDLRRRLLTAPEGGQIIVDLTLPGHITRRDHEDIPAAAAKYVLDYKQMRILRSHLPQIDANAERLRGQVGSTLQTTLDSALAQNGLWQAVETAESVRRQTTQRIDAWQQQLDLWREHLQEAEAALAHAEEALQRAAGQLFFLRGSAVSAALTRYERAAQAWGDAIVACRLAEVALSILRDLERASRSQAQRYQVIARRLQQCLPLLDRDAHGADKAQADGLIPDIELVDDALTTAVYSTMNPDPGAGLADVLARSQGRAQPVSAWDKLTVAEIVNILVDCLTPTFSHLSELSVEDLIVAREGEGSVERWHNRLQELAVPLCNLETVRLVDGDVRPKELAVLGVSNEHKTIFDQRPEMLVSTGDRSRIMALTATLGLPLSALKQWPVWLQALARRTSH